MKNESVIEGLYTSWGGGNKRKKARLGILWGGAPPQSAGQQLEEKAVLDLSGKGKVEAATLHSPIRGIKVEAPKGTSANPSYGFRAGLSGTTEPYIGGLGLYAVNSAAVGIAASGRVCFWSGSGTPNFSPLVAATYTLGTAALPWANTFSVAGTFASMTVSGLTAGRVVYATTGGALTTDADLTFDGTTLTTTGLSVGASKAAIAFSDASTAPALDITQSSTGDAMVRAVLSGGNSYAFGIDNSDSDLFKVSYGSAGNAVLGTNDYLKIATTGETTVAQWLRVGTATDAAAQGDISVGLTGAARLFFDQSGAVLALYNSAGTQAAQLEGVAGGNGNLFNTQRADIDFVARAQTAGSIQLDAANWAMFVDASLCLPFISPSQITADQNNYAPGADQNARRNTAWRLSSDASRNITGILAPPLTFGRVLIVINVGSNNIVLQNQNASSDAANRIITGTGADVTLAADDSAIMIYDDTTARWRIL